MRFIRSEKSHNQIVVADGEAGRGVYFYSERNRKMADYYLSGTNRIIIATPKPRCSIVDLTTADMSRRLVSFAREEIDLTAERMGGHYVKPKIYKSNVQRFGRIIMYFVRRYCPQADAYMVGHSGPGLPSGTQLVVLNLDAFDISEMTLDEYRDEYRKGLK